MDNKKEYRICNYGSEAITYSFFELTENEYIFLKTIFEKLNNERSEREAPFIKITESEGEG